MVAHCLTAAGILNIGILYRIVQNMRRDYGFFYGNDIKEAVSSIGKKPEGCLITPSGFSIKQF